MFKVVNKWAEWQVWEDHGKSESLVARCPDQKDAALIAAALSLIEGLIERFPGLVDGETEVNGADLVEAFDLKAYLAAESL